ncbi:MAG: HAMP domain-containing histidine kinase [Bacteroidales bacterium]|nr:HAMP domain-containing histidine kinase [Bacteroidales bacterium]MBN2749565.1 HAMP domain-containing histidine kinase [Bacteroidales bacterium]
MSRGLVSRIAISGIFLAFWTISSGQNISRIDSLNAKLESKNTPKKRVELLDQLSREYIPYSTRAMIYAVDANSLAREINDYELVIKTLFTLAKAQNLLLDKTQEPESHYSEAILIARKNNSTYYEAQTLFEWSQLDLLLNRFANAESKLLKADSLFRSEDRFTEAAKVNLALAGYMQSQHKFPAAESYYKKSNELFSKGIIGQERFDALVGLARLKRQQGNVSEMAAIYKGIMSDAEIIADLNRKSYFYTSLFAKTLVEYGIDLRLANQPDSSLRYINKGIDVICQFDTTDYVVGRQLAEFYLEHNFSLHQKGLKNLGEFSKDKAFLILEHFKDSFGLSSAHRLMADYHLKNGPLPKAAFHLKTFFHFVNRLDNPLLQAKAIGQIGLVQMKLGNFKNSLGAFRGGLRISSQYGFVALESWLYSGLANVSMFLDSPDSTVVQANLALLRNLNIGDTLLKYTNYCHLLSAYLAKADTDGAGDIVTKLLRFPSGLEYPMFTQYGYAPRDLLLGKFYLATGDYGRAYSHLEKSLQKSTVEEIKEVERDSYLALSEYYRLTANYQKALVYLHKHQKLKDEILNIYSRRLFTLYDLNERTVAQKLQNKILLREKEIQQEKLNQKELQLSLTAIAVAIFSVLSIALYINIRKRNKAYKMLAHQSNELLEKNRQLAEQKGVLEQSEEKIRVQNDDLTTLNHTKDKFFSIIAHDLRNPFTGLIGLTSYLIENVDDMPKDEVKELLQSVNSSSRETFSLLENLLDWARTQINSIAFNPSTFDLYDVVDSALKILTASANTKGVKLYNRVEVPTLVYADKYMVETIVRNLVGNALKYTSTSGRVEVISFVVDEKVRISVNDTGLGISSDLLEKLFSIEMVSSKVGTANEKGAGLGLVVCREFIQKHNEQIWAESNIGEGSSFYFTLKRPK